MNIDLFLFKAISGITFEFFLLEYIFIFFAKYFGYFLIFLLFFLLFHNFKKNKNLFVASLVAGFLSRYGVVEVIRNFSYRTRPFIEENILPLVEHEPTSSFPSGHASFFFALSTVVYFYNKKLGCFLFVSSFLIGFSRIVAGIHWPSDILIGALIGIAVGCIVGKISIKKSPKQ